ELLDSGREDPLPSTDDVTAPSDDILSSSDFRQSGRGSSERGWTSAWQRYPRETVLRRIPIPPSGRFPRIPLDQAQAPAGTRIEGLQDSAITLEGVVHQVGRQRAVSLFLVNRRQKLELSDRQKDERWMLQVRFEVFSSDKSAAFISRPGGSAMLSDDAEAHS